MGVASFLLFAASCCECERISNSLQTPALPRKNTRRLPGSPKRSPKRAAEIFEVPSEGRFLLPCGWVTIVQPSVTGIPVRYREAQQKEEVLMSLSKRAMLAAGSSLLVALSTTAFAQAPKGNKKSSELTNVDEGEAVMVGPQGRRLHKSKAKVTAAQHQAAMKKGAVEVKHGSVLYKQGGKLYLMQDSANEKASQHFQDQFDIDY